MKIEIYEEFTNEQQIIEALKDIRTLMQSGKRFGWNPSWEVHNEQTEYME